MNKQEITTVHRTLSEIKDYIEEQEGEELDSELFEEYKNLGVEPLHVQKTKSDHKKAVFLLAEALSESFSDVEGLEDLKEEELEEMDKEDFMDRLDK